MHSVIMRLSLFVAWLLLSSAAQLCRLSVRTAVIVAYPSEGTGGTCPPDFRPRGTVMQKSPPLF